MMLVMQKAIAKILTLMKKRLKNSFKNICKMDMTVVYSRQIIRVWSVPTYINNLSIIKITPA